MNYTIDKQIINLRCELARLLEVINNESEHLAACEVWNIADALTTSLICNHSKNPNVLSLAEFVRIK